MAALAETRDQQNYAHLLTLPRLRPTGRTLMYPTEPSWSFLAAATLDRISAGPTGRAIQAPQIDAIWQTDMQGGIRRWEQVDFPDGKRLVRIFAGVSHIGAFEDGQLQEANLYRLVTEADDRVWKGHTITPDGTLSGPHYPYAGTPLWPLVDMAEAQRARARQKREEE